MCPHCQNTSAFKVKLTKFNVQWKCHLLYLHSPHFMGSVVTWNKWLCIAEWERLYFVNLWLARWSRVVSFPSSAQSPWFPTLLSRPCSLPPWGLELLLLLDMISPAWLWHDHLPQCLQLCLNLSFSVRCTPSLSLPLLHLACSHLLLPWNLSLAELKNDLSPLMLLVIFFLNIGFEITGFLSLWFIDLYPAVRTVSDT